MRKGRTPEVGLVLRIRMRWGEGIGAGGIVVMESARRGEGKRRSENCVRSSEGSFEDCDLRLCLRACD